MRRYGWSGLVVLVSLTLPNQAYSSDWATDSKKVSKELAIVNARIAGQVIDHTANHGVDNRIWSRALQQKRDLYVYLPPNFCKDQSYAIMMYLHGFAVDEQSFLRMVPLVDEAIRQGKLPPIIMAAPDGSLAGEPCILKPGSFFQNTQAGDFEDYLLQDVWDFVTQNYPIRPERQAHVLAGMSMGGFAAFNLGIRHRDMFGVAIGIHPPLNTRWIGCNGNYFAKFDPHNWCYRTKLDNPNEVIAKFGGGLVKLRIKAVVGPLYGFGDDALAQIARQNPIELVDRTGLKNGDLAMYVGYAGKDQFNITAQVDSFLYLCKCRQIAVAVGFEPHGRHDTETAVRFLPSVCSWLAPQIAPFSP